MLNHPDDKLEFNRFIYSVYILSVFPPYISLHKYMVMEGMIEVFGLMFTKILRKEFFLSYKTNRQKQELKKSTWLYICMTKQDSSISISPTHQKKKGEK